MRDRGKNKDLRIRKWDGYQANKKKRQKAQIQDLRICMSFVRSILGLSDYKRRPIILS